MRDQRSDEKRREDHPYPDPMDPLVSLRSYQNSIFRGQMAFPGEVVMVAGEHREPERPEGLIPPSHIAARHKQNKVPTNVFISRLKTPQDTDQAQEALGEFVGGGEGEGGLRCPLALHGRRKPHDDVSSREAVRFTW